MRRVRISLLIAIAAPVFAVDFSLGVSAGDVTDESVILWTRADQPGDLRVELALDRGDDSFADIVQTATVAATTDNDRTVKLGGHGSRLLLNNQQQTIAESVTIDGI